MERKKADILKYLLILYDRPREPVFMPKGDDKLVFDISPEYFNDRFKPAASMIANTFGDEASGKIPIVPITIPELGEILDIHRDDNFTLFIPKHRRIAGGLIDLFLKVKDLEELLSLAVYCRDRVNPYLFNYSLTVALLHREETRDLDLPSFIRCFPDKYIDTRVFTTAREDANILPDGSRMPIEIPQNDTASELEIEQRLAYFREDIGINLHHWHWHLVYPFQASIEVVDKNRRGELFYYMHRQIMARYNFERLCNHLKRTERLIDFDKPIKEAYFPKLESLVSGRPWPARHENQRLKNLNRDTDQIEIDLDDLRRYRDRIYEAIHTGAIKGVEGDRILLTEFDGIDILGNLIESSILSLNSSYYGDLHNMGHLFISFIHDPENKYLESFGVMGDSATAMRDPIFYRWHAFIDDIFQTFKGNLPQYTVEQLDHPGIIMNRVTIESSGKDNVINTFWQQSDVDLSRGMDFQPRGSIFVRFTHLNHRNFTYRIRVVNQSGSTKQETCRIFLAPKFDERGNPWLFRDQKDMFIELDRFVVSLKQGKNTIIRESTLSSVTIPFDRTFRDVDTNRPTEGDALAQFNFCGCGWPQHMLVPKGRPEGMVCQLFVMISNYKDDEIVQDISGVCNDAEIFCGIKDKLYPDRRSMGFPFDRRPRSGVTSLDQFLTPNMIVQDITINFQDKTFRPKPKSEDN